METLLTLPPLSVSFPFTLFDPLNLLGGRVTVHLSVVLMRSPANIQATMCYSNVANLASEVISSSGSGREGEKIRRRGSAPCGEEAEKCLYFELSPSAHTGGHSTPSFAIHSKVLFRQVEVD